MPRVLRILDSNLARNSLRNEPHIVYVVEKKIQLNEGGSHENPHGFLGGVGQNSMFIHMGGRGGQKCPKNHPHGLWMFPYTVVIFHTLQVFIS